MTIEIKISRTASGGAWSFNTQKFTENAFLDQIICKAGTKTTAFHFYILDAESNPVFDTRDEGFKPTQILRREVRIPLVGIHTVGVINSSNSTETFTGKLVVSEGRVR